MPAKLKYEFGSIVGECLAVLVLLGLGSCQVGDHRAPVPSPQAVQTPSTSASISLETATYQDKNLGFSFDHPKSWTVSDARFTYNHYTNVFLTVDSLPQNLQTASVGSQPSGNTLSTGKSILPTIAWQMQSGEVYIEFASQGGLGLFGMHSDSVAGDLHALLAANKPETTRDPDLWQKSLNFVKRGMMWHVTAYIRLPFNEDDRKRVMALFDSIQFMDAPVSNIAWAESLAWQKLPASERIESNVMGWPIPYGFNAKPNYGGRTVEVQQSGQDYLFTFISDTMGEWKISVTKMGEVSVLSSPPSTSSPAQSEAN